MNWVDLIIIVALGSALFSGYRRGALMQFFSWGGFVTGLLIGGLLAPPIVEAINPSTPLARASFTLGIFLGVAFIVEAFLSVGGHRLRKRIHAPWAQNIDRVAGSFAAAVLSLVGAWFLGVTLKNGPSQQISSAIHGSAILRWTDSIAPRPPGFFAEIGRFLNRTGFPEVFAQLNPSLAPGVAPPPAALADDPEILGAAALTYKIESRGCGGLVDGSGFPVGERLVFTAAHVVAGTHDHRIIEPDGTSYGARVVYLDADKDIAILHASRRVPGPLTVEGRPAPRETDGAAIGYPGGGPRTISVARVRARTNALGRDIYSRKLVEREIYVLRAQVRRGNSGGPFVDTDGQVRGMVFAAATDDPNESYALSESELDRALDRHGGSTSAVATGSCAV